MILKLIGINFSYKIFQILIRIISLLVVSRLLIPEDFGKFVIFNSFLIIVFSFSVGSIRYLVIRQEVKQIYYSEVISVALINTTLGLILILPLMFGLNTNIRLIDLIVIYISIILCSLFYVFSILNEALMEIKGKFVELQKKTTICILIFEVIVPIILLKVGFNFWSLVVGKILSVIFYLYFIRLEVFFNFNKLNVSKVKDFLKNSYHILLSESINNLSSNIDNILISQYMGNKDLGLYSRSYNLIKIPADTIGVILNKITYVKKMERMINNFYSSVLAFIILMLVSFIFYFYADYIFIKLLGENWAEIGSYIKVACWGMYVRLLLKINENEIKKISNKILVIGSQLVYLVLIIFGISVGLFYNDVLLIILLLIGVMTLQVVWTSCFLFKKKEIFFILTSTIIMWFLSLLTWSNL